MTIRHDPEGAETQVIHDLVDFRGRAVLEIGCGDGRLTWRICDLAGSVLALDPKADKNELFDRIARSLSTMKGGPSRNTLSVARRVIVVAPW